MENDKLLQLIDSAINNAISQACNGCAKVPDLCKFHKTVLAEARAKIVEQGELLNGKD
jgi:hypothetical protein